MKKKARVLLLEDVRGLGRKYEIAVVSLGYLRNYLAPCGLAEYATDEVLIRTEGLRKKAEEERQARIAENKKKAEELKGITLVFERKPTKSGKLYGSISSDDIRKAIGEKGIEGASVKLEKPLKEFGEHTVKVSFGDGVSASVKISIKEK